MAKCTLRQLDKDREDTPPPGESGMYSGRYKRGVVESNRPLSSRNTSRIITSTGRYRRMTQRDLRIISSSVGHQEFCRSSQKAAALIKAKSSILRQNKP